MNDTLRRFRLALLVVSAEEIVSISEIAEALGVTKRSAITYSKRADFPPPVASLAVGRIWRRDDVENWGREQLPLKTGRPKKS